MARHLFSSHDGYGLGHIRRNTLIAAAVLEADPQAEVTLVTGVSKRPEWLRHPRLTVVEVPWLLEASDGSYGNHGMAFEERHRTTSAALQRGPESAGEAQR